MQIVIRKTNIDGIGNVLKAFISALSIHDNVVIECNNEYMYGKYNTILDDKHIYKGETDIEYFYTCRLLILREEENIQQNIPNENWYTDGCQNYHLNHYFSFNCLIDWNYDSNKLCSRVKNRILNSMNKIMFTSCVYDEMNNSNIDFNQSLAISVRTWRAKHENNIDRLYDFDTYKNKIISIIDEKQIKNIVFSIDNDSYIEPYILLFHEYQNINVFYIKQKETMNEIQFAIHKVLLLSKCNYLIANRLSTFSELIFWFSECNIIVYPLF
jgi:hypothetical protein